MAYNYPNYFYPQQNYQQNIQQNMPQSGGFITVRSEMEARNYPVAAGNSITFMSETEPYVYSKTMGFNQLDRPTFKKYRLVEEAESSSLEQKNENPVNNIAEEQNGEFGRIWDELEYIKKELKALKNPKQRKTIRKEQNHESIRNHADDEQSVK